MTPIAAPDSLDATADEAWILSDDACDPLRESSRESRFAVSNGFLGVRCSRAINQSGRLVLPPRTYVAGLFDTASADAPISALVPAANWLQLHVTTNIDAREHDPSKMSPHRLVLDMRRGMLMTESRAPNGAALGFHVRTLHLVSLSTRAIGLQLIEVCVEKGEFDITLEASVDEKDLGLVVERLDQCSGVWHTKESGKRLGMALTSSLSIDGAESAPVSVGQFSRSWQWTSRSGQVVFFERAVALARSDIAGHDVRGEARDTLDAARRLGWRGILAEHEAAWAQRWHDSDVVVEGDAEAQEALRFAIYHLNSAADPTDERVSIGARALTGEDYHGHVFWDTEIYLVPFYIMTWPEAARALLMYRFHTLDGARRKAARMGWRGALYAWESADSGDETAPAQVIGADRQVIAILSGQQEQHISADVAYAIWQYWQATRDEDFLLQAGAEILLETGRFWASRAVLEADGRRHIRGVIGPDEYHENIDDNAFTNVMARWNIRRALDVAALLRARWPQRWAALSHDIGLDDTELEQWRSAAETIVTGLDEKTGLFEQFAGYFALEDIDLAGYKGRSVPMDVVLGRERTQRSQVVKQADVVALLALLPEEFVGASAAANFRYYEPRCGHGSSLSRAMHAVVAARLADCDMALRYFEDTAAIDLCDTQAAIAGGIHIAAQGGIWLTAVFGFSGLSLRDDALAFDPHIPAGWSRLRYRVRWRGRRLRIDLDPIKQVLEVTLEEGEPMQLFVRGTRQDLRSGEPLRASLAPAGEALPPQAGLASKSDERV
jgi:trehalose/maltose hydrolase-like predicted phosphorylase